LKDHNSRAKLVAGWTGAHERTVKNWILGRYAPCGRHLVVLAQHSDAVLNAILSMADRQDLLRAQKVEDLRRKVFELAARIGGPGGWESPLPFSGKGWVPMPRQCGRPRCDLIGEPGPGPLGREGCQGLPLPPETNHVRPGPSGYHGGRGEGSIPVPLPPPLHCSPLYPIVRIDSKNNE